MWQIHHFVTDIFEITNCVSNCNKLLDMNPVCNHPQTKGILKGIAPFVPKSTSTHARMMPIISPIKKNLNSITPNCPLVFIKCSKSADYINFFRNIYKEVPSCLYKSSG